MQPNFFSVEGEDVVLITHKPHPPARENKKRTTIHETLLCWQMMHPHTSLSPECVYNGAVNHWALSQSFPSFLPPCPCTGKCCSALVVSSFYFFFCRQSRAWRGPWQLLQTEILGKPRRSLQKKNHPHRF